MEFESDPSPLQILHVSPPKPLKHPSFSFLLLFFFLLLLTLPTTTHQQQQQKTLISSSNFHTYYSKFCHDVVPESPATSSSYQSAKTLRFTDGFFSSRQNSEHDPRRAVSFDPYSLHNTQSDNVIQVQSNLVFVSSGGWGSIFGDSNRGRKLRVRQFRVRGPKFPVRSSDRLRLNLYGYWSNSTGKLCMVGSSINYYNKNAFSGGIRPFNAVLKLNYPVKSSINGSFIGGVLESFSDDRGVNVSILSLSKNSDYEYTLTGKEESFQEFDDGGGSANNLNITNGSMVLGFCSVLKRYKFLELDYENSCEHSNCSPLGGNGRFSPKTMILTFPHCSDSGEVQMLLKFHNVSYIYYSFDPSAAIIGEGKWEWNENRLCGVMCRILNFTKSGTDTVIGDCSIRLCLRFPAIFSIRNRSPIVGQMWSNKKVNESGYFMKINFHGSRAVLSNGRYEYSVIDRVRDFCTVTKLNHKGAATYPHGNSFDMRFDMAVKNKKRQTAAGSAVPLFVGAYHYRYGLYGVSEFSRGLLNQTYSAVFQNSMDGVLLNISYTMSFTPSDKFLFGGEYISSRTVGISAEGTYNRKTGTLCMIGCRRLTGNKQQLAKNDTFDCEMKVSIQFPPSNGKRGEKIKGTIESMRETSDPLYFETLELSSNSINYSQAKKSIWRIDLEIVMVLVSNTLTCLFVVLQLLHGRKHPDVLPSISIVMLGVLTLGHMIPLLLNFEAFFVANRSRQNVFLESGGWLKVDEVVVRVVTMIAFLLELRLLHLTWSARQADGGQKDAWIHEKKVLYVSSPLYIVGGLTACLAHLWKNSHRSTLSYHRTGFMRTQYQQNSLWVDLKLYAGLVLDGFLLPQILFNLFSHSTGKALSSFFYGGTTVVRLLPHAYDLYRAQSSSWYLDTSFIYANHRMDFYSTAWNIIIPCCGLVFCILIYLQQRFGGKCIIPRRFRKDPVYEKVPSISNEEL